MTFQEIIEKIFQSYDVRGTYPDEYHGDIAYRIGRAVVAHTRARKVIIGRDVRRGGHAILSALAFGAMDQGADVTDAGLCSSDALYHAGHVGGFDLSLMVTASHNPPEFIGTKLVRADGTSIGRNSGLPEVQRMVLSGKFPRVRRRGHLSRHDRVMPEFVRHALRFIRSRRLKPFKIVVDAGNGMGGLLIDLLRPRVPFRIVPMYFEPDGTFPNHPPDPTRPPCVRALRRRVLEEQADLGIGFDGDADRCALIDERGRRISGSELGSVIAKRILREQPGAKIGYCLVSSWTKRDTILEAGGRPVITPVGGANIRPIMRRRGVVFTSERSGHFYLAANHFADSGLIAALIALEELSIAGGTMSELIRPYRRYYMAPEKSLLLGARHSSAAELGRLKARRMAAIENLTRGARVIERGGAKRYEFNDWWFCVRPSGTEPRMLRMTVEATSRALMKEKYAEILRLLMGG